MQEKYPEAKYLRKVKHAQAFYALLPVEKNSSTTVETKSLTPNYQETHLPNEAGIHGLNCECSSATCGKLSAELHSSIEGP
jgi:hypothetical protein